MEAMNTHYTSLPMSHAETCKRISAVCACVYDLGLPKIMNHPFLCTFDQVYAWACEFVRDHELGEHTVYDYEDSDMDWDEHIQHFFNEKLKDAVYDTGQTLRDVKNLDKS